MQIYFQLHLNNVLLMQCIRVLAVPGSSDELAVYREITNHPKKVLDDGKSMQIKD